MLTAREQQFEDDMRIMDEVMSGVFDKKFEDIIDHLEHTYKQDNNDWAVMFSGGKDSALTLDLVMKMLKRLSPFERTKKVHVVSADTKVETKVMTDFLKRNLQLIKENSVGLNIEVHLVQPDIKNSFYWNVIGKGYPYPNSKSPFQWCTFKHKIKPMNEKMTELLSVQPFSDCGYKMTMLLGVRLDESTRRAASIERHAESEFFARHNEFQEVRVYHPVKFIKTADLWAYLDSSRGLAWGLPFEELFEMYSNGKECPIALSQSEKTEACGKSNSRNGCWTCLYTGREDKMLQTLIDKGHDDAYYLAEYKAYLFDVRNDVRYREPIGRRGEREIERESGSIALDLFEDAFASEHELSFKYYQRADKSSYNPGGFTFELRLKLLQKLLYTQEMVGYQLISDEEYLAVLEAWREDGYEVSEEDLEPIDHEHDGVLVLKPNATVNVKETTIEHMAFTIDVKFEMPLDKIAEFLKKRQVITQQSYYCFFNYQEFNNFNYVFNVLTFVVSKRFIDTKEEALEALYKFLFPESEEISVIVENEMVRSGQIYLDVCEDVLSGYEHLPESVEFHFLTEWLFNSKKLAVKFKGETRQTIPLNLPIVKTDNVPIGQLSLF